MNITLAQLNKLALESFPHDNVSLIRILIAWAQMDPGGELVIFLKSADLTCHGVVEALNPLIASPSKEDLELLNRIIMTDTDGPVTGWHLLQALCDHPGHRVTRALVAAGLKLSALRKNLRQNSPLIPSLISSTRIIDPECDLLERYGRNLTTLVRDGVFDNLCNREEDVNRVMVVLQKKNRGNSVLTGPAGLGKTAIVELLAKRIVQKTVPRFFMDYQLFEISMGKLLAGTIYRGQFEERLEKRAESANGLSTGNLVRR